jgi:hypothetical protein
MRLVDALDELELDAELVMEGRWARIRGERCPVYVIEMSRHRGFFTWCDDPDERSLEYHADPLEAVRSGLRRAELKSAADAVTSSPDDDVLLDGGP